ncbi:MAG TPA: hypothetical protein VFL41_02735 [Gaiellaceae bacterium]|nr:hypothetical protein [Gaiellaceae bacterium]HET8653562.1 hypothetical protein [Gaiellaceae bacterium]
MSDSKKRVQPDNQQLQRGIGTDLAVAAINSATEFTTGVATGVVTAKVVDKLTSKPKTDPPTKE